MKPEDRQKLLDHLFNNENAYIRLGKLAFLQERNLQNISPGLNVDESAKRTFAKALARSDTWALLIGTIDPWMAPKISRKYAKWMVNYIFNHYRLRRAISS